VSPVCSASMPCPSGQMCTSAGECVAAPDAGRSVDAGHTDAGQPNDARVDPPPCVIAGGTDADGDGVCAGDSPADDCDDSDPRSYPGAIEVCTDSEGGLPPANEDCDGARDEGCALAFGVPHPLVDIASSAHSQWFPRLSSDGLRLYTGAYDRATDRTIPHVATRSARDARFEPSVPLPGDWSAGSGIYVVSPTADELEVFVQVAADGLDEIRVATRTSRSMPFGPTTVVLGAPGFWRHPAVSADGLALYAEGDTGGAIYRATRASRTEAFGEATSVVSRSAIPGVSIVHSPWPLSDGSLLFMASDGTATRVYRVEPSESGFGVPVELAGLAGEAWSGYQGMSYSENTREIFFTTNRAWTALEPEAYGSWRLEVCLDGACPARTVACEAGVASSDGLHCYESGGGLASWADARASCFAAEKRVPAGLFSSHLVTLHSEAERTLVWSNFGSASAITGTLWLGADDATTDGTWVWTSGEPFTYAQWGEGEPSSGAAANGLALWWAYDGLFADASQATAYGYVCETELWPTW
jgi:hypothetical protein